MQRVDQLRVLAASGQLDQLPQDARHTDETPTFSQRFVLASKGSRPCPVSPSMSARASTSAPQSGHTAGSGSRTSMANCARQPRHSPATVSRRSGDAAGRCVPRQQPRAQLSSTTRRTTSSVPTTDSSQPRTPPASSAQRSASIGAMTLLPAAARVPDLRQRGRAVSVRGRQRAGDPQGALGGVEPTAAAGCGKPFPRARFLVRLDGGFATPEVFDFIEAERVDYVVARRPPPGSGPVNRCRQSPARSGASARRAGHCAAPNSSRCRNAASASAAVAAREPADRVHLYREQPAAAAEHAPATLGAISCPSRSRPARSSRRR